MLATYLDAQLWPPLHPGVFFQPPRTLFSKLQLLFKVLNLFFNIIRGLQITCGCLCLCAHDHFILKTLHKEWDCLGQKPRAVPTHKPKLKSSSFASTTLIFYLILIFANLIVHKNGNLFLLAILPL